MDRSFRDSVYKIVASIPSGKVMAYGQIAAICGYPSAARAVGQIAHFGPDYLPWHRVVGKSGKLANGFPLGGPHLQAKLLGAEGVIINNYRLNIEDYLWQPQK